VGDAVQVVAPMTNWIILLVVAVWTLAALLVCSLLWAHGARRQLQPPKDYQE